MHKLKKKHNSMELNKKVQKECLHDETIINGNKKENQTVRSQKSERYMP